MFSCFGPFFFGVTQIGLLSLDLSVVVLSVVIFVSILTDSNIMGKCVHGFADI